jgi:acylphosphatase
MKINKHLRIYGLVQGVCYRESLRQQAQSRGVCGWVRNRRDGSVEAMLQGDEMAVETLVAWCRMGPARARVERVDIGEGEEQEKFVDFERLGTI